MRVSSLSSQMISNRPPSPNTRPTINSRLVGIGYWFVVSVMAAGCSQSNDKVEAVISAAAPVLNLATPDSSATTVDFCGQTIQKGATWVSCVNQSAPSLEPLSELTSLKELVLQKCGTGDLAPISHLHKIERLDLQGSKEGSLPLTSIDPVANLENLHVFKLTTLNVPLEPLSQLKALEEVWIDDDRSFDRLEVMSGLVNLKRLAVRRTGVKDLAPISGLTQLEELYLSPSDVRDLKPLAKLKRLRSLEVPDKVTDLSPLADLPMLKELDLDNSDLKDADTLKALTGLTRLMLSSSSIKNISGLSNLKLLESLSLDHCDVTDISSLKGLSALTVLNLSWTKVRDFTPLQSLEHLKTLDLTSTTISDLSFLDKLPALEKVTLDGALVDRNKVQAFRQSHPKVKVVYDAPLPG